MKIEKNLLKLVLFAIENEISLSHINVTEGDIKNLILEGYVDKSYSEDRLIIPREIPFNIWVRRWINKWPTKLIKTDKGSYRVSGNTMQCMKRMKRFQKELGFDRETIDLATDRYLAIQEENRWLLTKKNSKFIMDNEGSLLENYCNDIINKEEINNENVFVSDI